MFRNFRLALVLCALQACSSESSPDEAPLPTLPEATRNDLQQTLDGVVKAEVAPGVSVVVQRPGYAAWSGSAGVRDIESRAALTSEQRFRAGSTLKVAVAITVLQLVEEARLSLDDTLDRILPSEIAARVPSAKAITLRMLLAHTSGIPEFSDAAFHDLVSADPTHVWSLDELLERALSSPPLFAPGTSFGYSNTNYVLLGEILRHTTGKSWRKLVRERVLSRAGMQASSLPEEGNPTCDACSRGYAPTEEQLVDVTEIDPSMAGAAGGDALITTPADLAKLLSALTSGKMFDHPDTFDQMLSFVDAPNPEEAQTGYGLGLQRFDVGGVTLFGHLGGTAGFQSFFMYQPGSGAIVSGYMNRNGNFGAFVLPVLDAAGRAMAAPAGA